MGWLPLGWWPIYEKQGRPGTGAGRRWRQPFPVVTGSEVGGGHSLGHGGDRGTRFGPRGGEWLIGDGSSMVTRASGGEPLVVGQRSGGGHRLGGHVAEVSLGRGHGDDVGVRDGWRRPVRMGILEEVDGG
jgi:hypothetical protein